MSVGQAPSPPEPASLAVVVVSWNTRDLLAGCLASVEASRDAPACEVWVVDNGSTDGSAEMVRAHFPAVRLIANRENVGFARANNQALRQVSAEFVLLLNPDAALHPHTLAALWAFMRGQPRAGIVGATLLNPDGSFQSSHADFPRLVPQLVNLAGLSRWVYGPHFPSHGPSADRAALRADWVGGACLMVRRAALLAAGLLDEDFFMYGEEMEWCYRMWASGWEVYSLPAATCVHWRGQSSRQVSEYTLARLAATSYLFFRKHYGRPRTLALQGGMLLLGLAKALVFGGLYAASAGRQTRWKAKASANLRLAGTGLRPQRFTAAVSSI